jgi:hypothetical protein
MSLNVLVIPEDATHDKDALEPIVKEVFVRLGKPRAKIKVYAGFHGRSEALDPSRLGAVVDQYKGKYDLFLLMVDRDGDSGRKHELAARETQAKERLRGDQLLLGIAAHQELEVWVMAAHDLEWEWQEVRAEPQPKKRFYAKFAGNFDAAWATKPSDGLKTFGKIAASRYDRICRRCPEIVCFLESRIREWLEATGR